MNKKAAIEKARMLYPWANYVARDYNGEWWAYKEKPMFDEELRLYDTCDNCMIVGYGKYIPSKKAYKVK